MEENTQQTITPAMPTTDVVYASFLQRFLAAIIDWVVVAFAIGILTAILSSVMSRGNNMMFNPFGMLIWGVYAVGMTTKYGATLGKMALGIKVVNQDTKQNLGVVEAFLREVVGKFLSQLVLFLGYLWMLWDPHKQTWHDKIAKSIVIKA